MSTALLALERANPDPREPQYSEERIQRAIRTITTSERIESPVAGTLVEASRSRRWSSRRFVAGAAAASVLVAGSFAFDSVTVNGQTKGASAEAVEVLTWAAAKLASTPDLVVGPHQYLRRRTGGFSTGELGPGFFPHSGGTLIVQPQQSTTWTPGSPEGIWVSKSGGAATIMRVYPKASTRRVERRIAEDASPVPGGPVRYQKVRDGEWFGAFGTSAPDRLEALVKSLPPDPHASLDLLYRYVGSAGPSAQYQVWRTIERLFGELYVTNDQRALLLQTLALIPGVEVAQDSASARPTPPAIAIVYTEAQPDEQRQQQLLLDPETGHPIGSREVLLAGRPDIGMPAGTVQWEFITQSDVVDHAPIAKAQWPR